MPTPTFFEPGRTYAARAGWSDGRERFRFVCEEVFTDPATGQPLALGQHGTRRRDSDDGWDWVPNPRTHEDWDSRAWFDITDELTA